MTMLRSGTVSCAVSSLCIMRRGVGCCRGVCFCIPLTRRVPLAAALLLVRVRDVAGGRALCPVSPCAS